MRFTKLLLIVCSFTIQLYLQHNQKVHATQNFVKKSPPSSYISTVQVTPFGVLAGENDSRVWQQPYNGLYLSTNFGETWTQFGLNNRGITDISYNKNKIFVTTNQVINKTVGLFASIDNGQTWDYEEKMNFGMLSVASYKDTVVVGGASHGLWISFDAGNTWQQKIGDTKTTIGPDIFDIALSEGLFLASSNSDVYVSKDNGQTWDTITTLKNKGIKTIGIGNNTALAGAQNTNGLFRSTNNGVSWKQDTNWGNFETNAISHFKNSFYAGKRAVNGKYSLYRSTDDGVTWNPTAEVPILLGRINSMSFADYVPNYIFVTTQNDGIHRQEITDAPTLATPFLDAPWNTQNKNEILDKVYSFFDHAYPLLGYNYHSQPINEEGTTTNFLGEKLPVPDLYYDTHNGIDFFLSYGTKVLAPAPGFATYNYCIDCGNSIKIDHQNGYQTTYMHLQNEGLITKSNVPVWVDTKDIIGKVGLTGNTTGPHLHFSVKKDKDSDGFVNDFPTGLVDPFGWQNSNYSDPWETYSWTDVLGEHQGTKSAYLWNFETSKNIEAVSNEKKTIVQDNKIIDIKPGTLTNNAKFYILPYVRPKVLEVQNNLQYISNTSLAITAYNIASEKITELQKPLEIEIDLTKTDFNNKNINKETIQIYFLNEQNSTWEPLTTLFLDLIDKKIRASTDHLSYFAALAQKIDSTPPITSIMLDKTKTNLWFTKFPTVSFTTQEESVTKTFYKIAGEVDWNEYIQPFILEKEGVFGIEYFSVDEYDNREKIQDILVRVDTQNIWKNSVLIKNAQFNFNE